MIENWRKQVCNIDSDRDYDAEKKEWIENFGSPLLKKSLQLGYPCNDTYAREFIAKEFPGWKLWNYNLRWQISDVISEVFLSEIEALLAEGLNVIQVDIGDDESVFNENAGILIEIKLNSLPAYLFKEY